MPDAPPHNEISSSLPPGSTAGNSSDAELEARRKMNDGEQWAWQLTVDDNVNQEIRRHFCFDQVCCRSEFTFTYFKSD